eukprot:188001-Prymnesium_polylepis.1
MPKTLEALRKNPGQEPSAKSRSPTCARCPRGRAAPHPTSLAPPSAPPRGDSTGASAGASAGASTGASASASAGASSAPLGPAVSLDSSSSQAPWPMAYGAPCGGSGRYARPA